MIVEDFVSFEIAKLLKEKGFDGECFAAYNGNGKLYESDKEVDDNTPYWSDAPTLQMAMKWLREVHKLHVYVGRDVDKSRWYSSIEIIDIEQEENQELLAKISRFFYMGSGDYQPSYKEVCEEAIKYCLENLV